MNRSPILGTRGSPLALVQAHKVASALEVANRCLPTSCRSRRSDDWRPGAGPDTCGNRRQAALDQGARPCADGGGGRFLRPFAEGLEAIRPARDQHRRGSAHAVTSGPADGADSIDDLPQGAVVGTSSPRRKAQLLSIRPDSRSCRCVGTCDPACQAEAGEVQATLLAGAGLRRLGMANVRTPFRLK